uniref:MAP6 domain containing 1 n=1 Tax=Oncorhynchus kisutch TaxID=8019 RepID=A0A8C7JPT3_ONCKI
MAWPCISRVCCLARFWNQFDKSDLSVPLTIQNYSDITDQEVQSVTRQVPTDRDYQQTGVPFSTVTQYKQDYKPWPIPKKENFPWISNVGKGGEDGSDSPVNSNPNASQTRGDMGEREERGRQRWGEQGTVTAKSSYRKQRPPAPYASPGSGVSHLPNETSYQAAYNGGGEAFRHTELHQRDHTPSTSTADLLTPTVPQNTVTPLQPYSIATTTPITTTASLQQSSLPERPDLSIGTMGEVRGLLFLCFTVCFRVFQAESLM